MKSLTFCLFFSVSASAALLPDHFKASKENIQFIEKGVFIGGTTSGPQSLLKARFLKGKKSPKERMVLIFGDLNGEQLKRATNYFHAKVLDSPQQVVIDISRTEKTTIGPAELRKKSRSSQFIKDADITMDPLDDSTSLILTLKKKARVAVFAREKSPGIVFIEFQEVKN